MKTQLFRVSALALAVSSMIFCLACEEKRVQAQVPLFTPAPTASPTATADLPNPAPTPEAPVAAGASTNAAPDQPPAVKVVQTPAPAEDLKASPALAEVIKLVNSGVSEEVLMAYVTNTSQPFNLNSDQIVYLNDLGVSSTVITSLIHHDSLPAVAAARSTPTTPPTLPPGVALTAPAPNIYAPTSPAQPAPPTAPEVDPNAAAVYSPPATVAAEPPPTPEYFDSSLAPYGTWLEVEGYGRCWQPTVAVIIPTWRPYCDRGHWVWTDCGWYWYSDYSWGWAPFHYGRWCSHPRVGWFWVPDTCWGPAWVSWRQTPGYCGWAPLPPAAVFVAGHGFYHHGIGVGFGFDFGLGVGLFTFVPLGHFHDRSFYSYRVPPHQVATIYHSSTVVNNYTVSNNGTVVNHGIGLDSVARASGHRIATVTVQTSTAAGQGRPIRHEQLQNNGTTLAVVRPPLLPASNTGRPVTAASAPRTTAPFSSSRVPPGTKSPNSQPILTPKATETGIPTVNAHPEGTVPPLRGQAVIRNNATTAHPDPVPSVRPGLVSPPGSFADKQGATSTDGRTTPAPAPLLRQPRTSHLPAVPTGTMTTARTETPESRSPLVPPVGQTPGASVPPQAARPVNVSPPSTVQPEMYRVYPQPSVAARPASPRYDNAAPQFSRPAPVPSMPAAPQFTPAPSFAPPSHYSEPPRMPAMRSEPSRAPAAVPSAPHSVPSSGSRSGGGKKD